MCTFLEQHPAGAVFYYISTIIVEEVMLWRK
jgi:hypothetical protein